MDYLIIFLIGYIIGKNIKWIINEIKYFWSMRKRLLEEERKYKNDK